MPVYVFFFAMVMADGSLSSDSIQLPECPPQEKVSTDMAALVAKGTIKDWSAFCTGPVLMKPKGQGA